MNRIQSFPPVAGPDPRVLILGSMPGRASLDAAQYYAHPRNAFWPIMGQLLGFAPDEAYPKRLEALKSAGIALWDVLLHCSRSGSLDASIDTVSERANDIPGFLLAHPTVERIYFNGSKAAECFKRHVRPHLGALESGLSCQRLPSTSPAHAALSLDAKLRGWETILEPRSRAPDRSLRTFVDAP
ncbi:MAG: DNA-deoxyinosine glycosylase [Methylotetracoccus sp.]